MSTAAGLLGSPAVVRRVLTDFAPDVIQGWLYHGNLMAALLGRAYGAPVVWNIRQSLHTREMEKRHASMTRKVLTWLHRMPAKIVYNSAVARTEHERIGFPRDKGIVIPNGFDIDKFRPDPTAQTEIRRELAIPENAILVGQIGRDHVMKGHDIFLQAATIAAGVNANIYFMAVGRGVDRDQKLRALAANPKVAKRIRLLGERQDINRLQATLNIACNSSFSGEGFSNAIGEAMSCGVPCIVTDVGDARRVVGASGEVIPPGQPKALAEAILRLAASCDGRQTLGGLARERVTELYAIDRICESYDDLYRSIMVEIS